MDIPLARKLHQAGKGHAWASCLLYAASIRHATEEGIQDPELFAFNGTASLSVHYLLGLGLELMLKATIVVSDPQVDEGFLRNTVRHDLRRALDEAEARGFATQAPHLREIVEALHTPFLAHWFRYGRPDQMLLPGDMEQVVETLRIFEDELGARLAELENAA